MSVKFNSINVAKFSLLVLFTIALTGAATSASDTGAVGYWGFDDQSGSTALDAAAGNDGSIGGSATLAATGVSGDAFRFDGSDDHVDMPLSSEDMSGDPSFSISAWVKVDSDAPKKNHVFVFGDSDPDYNGDIFGLRTNNDGGWRYYSGAGGFDASVSDYYGKWVHITATYNASRGEMELYHNGDLVGSSSATPDIPDDAYVVGARENGGSVEQGMDGKMDEVRWFDRELTQNQINERMNVVDNPTTLTLEADGSSSYEISFDGSVEMDPDNIETASLDGSKVTGDLGSGDYDTFHYSGSITGCSIDSSVNVYRNGSSVDTAKLCDTQEPYGGSNWAIPGRIEAEDFDTGGQDVSFSDTDSSNNGGAYRDTAVDIESTADSNGEYNVGWIENDEWLEYTVDVDKTGTYDLDLRVARDPSGSSSMHVEVDGEDVTGQISIPSTGGWQKWENVTVENVSLDSGEHTVRLYFDGSSFNINYMEWKETSTSSDTDTDSDTVLGYWPFNRESGSAVDVAASEDGEVKGEVNRGVAGIQGQAFNFDSSTGDHVRLPLDSTDSSLSLTGDSSFTVTSWVRVDSDAPKKNHVFVFGDSDPDFDGDVFGLRTNNDGGWRYYTGSGGFDASVSDYYGKWVHVAATYNASTGDMYLYHNGNRHGPVSASPSIPEGSVYTVGARRNGGSVEQGMNGKMDDVRWYNYALSQNAIEKRMSLESKPNTLTLQDDSAAYSIGVSGSVAADPDNTENVSVSGSAADGSISGFDTLHYSGDMMDCSFKSSTTIYLNGSEADEAELCNPPAAPTNLGATAGDTRIDLDWNDSAEGDLSHYNVYRDTSSGVSVSDSTRIASGLTSSSYSDTGLSRGTSYYYVVTAVDDSGRESDASNEASATTNAAPTASTGKNRTVDDSDGDGSETVTLDGSASSDSDGSISSYSWLEDGTEIATGETPDVSLGLGIHEITLEVTDDDGATDTSKVNITVKEADGQGPYGGSAWSIPGRIQAEDFDTGGQDVAYSDADSSNNGGAYRDTAVDIQEANDVNNGYNVGWIDNDEWLEYTVDVESSGKYRLDLRIARDPSSDTTMHVEVDGKDVTGPITIPGTGGWQKWENVTVENVSLDSGKHTVRMYFDGKSFNVNYMEWRAAGSTSSLSKGMIGHWLFNETSGSTVRDYALAHDGELKTAGDTSDIQEHEGFFGKAYSIQQKAESSSGDATGEPPMNGYWYKGYFFEWSSIHDRKDWPEYTEKLVNKLGEPAVIGADVGNNDWSALEGATQESNKIDAVARWANKNNPKEGDVYTKDHRYVYYVSWFFPSDVRNDLGRDKAFDKAANGDYNDHYRAFAERLKKHNLSDQVIIRLHPEHNGAWQGYVGDDDGDGEDNVKEFRQAWRHYVKTMRDVDSRIMFAYSPSLNQDKKLAVDAYPGDKYVDYLGLSGIHDGTFPVYEDEQDVCNEDCEYPDCSCECNDRLFSVKDSLRQCTTTSKSASDTSWTEAWHYYRTNEFGLKDAASFSDKHDLPMAFLEWGLKDKNEWSGGDNPRFINAKYQWMKEHNVHFQTEFEALGKDHHLASGNVPNALDKYQDTFKQGSSTDWIGSDGSGGTTTERNDRIALPDLGLSGHPSFTVAAWVKIDSDAPQDNHVFFFGDSSPEYDGDVFGLRTNGEGAWRMYTGDSTLDVATATDYYGKWVHVAATYNASTQHMYIYQNGTQYGPVQTKDGNVDIPADSVYYLGARVTDSSIQEGMNGLVEGAVWYDHALSADKIERLSDVPTGDGDRTGLAFEGSGGSGALIQDKIIKDIFAWEPIYFMITVLLAILAGAGYLLHREGKTGVDIRA